MMKRRIAIVIGVLSFFYMEIGHAEDLSGNATAESINVSNVDNVAPKIHTISELNKGTTILYGKTESNSIVYARVGTREIGKATSTDSGDYTVTIPTQKVGTKITVYAIDKAGNRGESRTITQSMESPAITSIQGLVNKKNALLSSYRPKDLIVPNVRFSFSGNSDKRYMRKDAAKALEQLFNAAKREKVNLYAVSGFRSYSRQKTLYNHYVKQMGQANADRVSARPGHSEHQTGLAMDVSSASVGYDLVESFGNTKEGRWVENHAYKYGFIVRYPKGKEHITGYKYEPWHLRYVGKDIAQILKNENLTYEDFFKKYVNTQRVNFNQSKIADMKKYDGGNNHLTYINGKGYSQYFYENTKGTYQFVPQSWLQAAGLKIEVKIVNGRKVMYITNPYLGLTPSSNSNNTAGSNFRVSTSLVKDMNKLDGGSNHLTYINGKGYSQFFYENVTGSYQFVPQSWLKAAGLTVEVKTVGGVKKLYISNPYKK